MPACAAWTIRCTATRTSNDLPMGRERTVSAAVRKEKRKVGWQQHWGQGLRRDERQDTLCSQGALCETCRSQRTSRSGQARTLCHWRCTRSSSRSFMRRMPHAVPARCRRSGRDKREYLKREARSSEHSQEASDAPRGTCLMRHDEHSQVVK